jgi:hypothetical protein
MTHVLYITIFQLRYEDSGQKESECSARGKGT